MSNKERQRQPASSALPGTAGVEPTTEVPAPNVAMDRWFQQQLTLLYNDVVNEPLPEEFLRIIGKIGKETKPR